MPSPTFYELESSSPAVTLKPGKSVKHSHRAFHFSGDKAKLDVLAQKVLGFELKQVEEAFQ